MKNPTSPCRSTLIVILLSAIALLGFSVSVRADIIYSNAGPLTVVGDGAVETTNVLMGGELNETATSSNTLYVSFTVPNPPGPFDSGYFSDGVQLAYSNGVSDTQMFFTGKTFFDWPYDCFAPSLAADDIYLNSATPESGEPYQYIRDTDITTIIFRVQYNRGAYANVTVWLNPDLSLPENAQPASLTTTLTNECYPCNEVELYNINYDSGTAAGGPGSGVWVYNNFIIATAATDVGFAPVAQMQISQIGNSVTISWTGTGTLQTAPTPAGPWTQAADQDNPQTMTATGSAEFFRVSQ